MVTTNLQTRPSWPQITWKTFAVVLPFLLLYWADMWHHTMFFDEVNAWAISAWSPTLAKLFYYVHFEGHPWLWYFLLWFPSRLTHDPVAMKWLEVVFGTANILIIGFLSPFTYRQRALILCSYFMVWEYTVMCRMYSVMLMLVLLYAVRRFRNPQGIALSCFLLGLAGNTDMSGMMLGAALLIEYLYSTCVAVPAEQRKAALKRWIPGLLVYLALTALSVATLWPSKQISWQSSGRIGSMALNWDHIDAAIGNMIAATWWPISPNFPHRFWETSVVDAHWLYFLMPVVLFVYIWEFRRNRNLLLLMACVLIFGIVFADVVYVGRVRHWGISWVAFLFGLWMLSAREAESTGARRSWSVWVYALMGLSAFAGLCALAGSWKRPFSRAREAATWIRRNQPANVVVTGMPDVSFASLAEELQQPAYFPECDCILPFKMFSNNMQDYDESNYPRALEGAMAATGRDSLIFSDYQLLQPKDIQRIEDAGMSVTPIAQFPHADMVSESFYLYQVRRK